MSERNEVAEQYGPSLLIKDREIKQKAPKEILVSEPSEISISKWEGWICSINIFDERGKGVALFVQTINKEV